MNSIFQKIQKNIIAFSGFSTTIVMLLIIVFIFRFGFEFFGSSPMSEPTVLITSKDIKVKSVTSQDIRKIFDGDYTNWKSLNGGDKPIQMVTLDQMIVDVPEDSLGIDMVNLPKYINRYFATQEGAIGYIPKEYYTSAFPGNTIELQPISLGDFFSTKWLPTATPVAQFGALPLILGTLLVSVLSIIIAVPFGLMVAIYLSEIAHPKVKNIVKPLVELLAGIPSVVYGFFGLVVIVPLVQQLFGLDVGETALTGGIILAIMALPTIITVTEDAISAVPQVMRDASLALGANQWQTIYRVIIPYASSGIISAIVLGVGRAMGETMAVLMVTGNASVMPTSIFESVRTIPATIAAELGEAPYEGLHFNGLFALGCVLFVFTMLFNLYVNYIKHKNKIN